MRQYGRVCLHLYAMRSQLKCCQVANVRIHLQHYVIISSYRRAQAALHFVFNSTFVLNLHV